MTDNRATLGTTLFKELDKLRETKGQISMEDAGSIVATIMGSRNDSALQQEIVRMVKDIEDAKAEILALSENKAANQQAMSDASLHLDTVIKSTEDATNNIMDAVDAIKAIIEGMGGEKEEKIQEACTKIFEACNFQDLTSQRIKKVIKLITTVEEHVQNLLKLFNVPTSVATPQAANTSEIVLPKDDRELLNGPQLPQDAISQNDVDDLFKSLKSGS
jgi:chemotaxis protein CheZ